MCNSIMSVDTESNGRDTPKSKSKKQLNTDVDVPKDAKIIEAKNAKQKNAVTDKKKAEKQSRKLLKKIESRKRRKEKFREQKRLQLEREKKTKTPSKSHKNASKQSKDRTLRTDSTAQGIKGHRQKLHKGHAPKFHGKLSRRFLKVYVEEQKFIENVMKHLPKLGRNEEDLENYLLESDYSDVEQAELVTEPAQKSGKKRAHNADEQEPEDSGSDEDDGELDQREKFLQSLKEFESKKKAKTEDEDVSREELKARLAAKIEAIRKSKERTSLKPKKKKKKDKQADDKKKQQFISKANPNATGNKTGGGGGGKNTVNVKDDTNSISSTASSTEQKTPLRKNKVVKSNGQIVYSKFDFISDDKYYNTKQYTEKKVAPKPEDILKKVEKFENKVAKLETTGKTSEAVALTDETKWATALKRAQGEKVRDDPTLLRRTIKKETKLKDVKKKKWKERVDHVEKQKQKVQDKRQANIQQRKDEQKKRTKKLQRKRGRIA